MIGLLPRRMRPYYTYSGRTGRMGFWFGQIALIGACPLVALPLVPAALGLQGTGMSLDSILLMLAPVIMIATPLLVLAGFAATVRRMHDRDKGAVWIWVYFGPAFVMWFTGIGTGESMLDWAMLGAWSGIGVLYFVELGFLAGTPGENRFGPPVGAAGEPEAARLGAAPAEPILVDAPLPPVLQPRRLAQPKPGLQQKPATQPMPAAKRSLLPRRKAGAEPVVEPAVSPVALRRMAAVMDVPGRRRGTPT